MTHRGKKVIYTKFDDEDAFITFTGRKGTGLTTASVAFCNDVASEIAEKRGLGESPKKFFDCTKL